MRYNRNCTLPPFFKAESDAAVFAKNTPRSKQDAAITSSEGLKQCSMKAGQFCSLPWLVLCSLSEEQMSGSLESGHFRELCPSIVSTLLGQTPLTAISSVPGGTRPFPEGSCHASLPQQTQLGADLLCRACPAQLSATELPSSTGTKGGTNSITHQLTCQTNNVQSTATSLMVQHSLK